MILGILFDHQEYQKLTNKLYYSIQIMPACARVCPPASHTGSWYEPGFCLDQDNCRRGHDAEWEEDCNR